MEPNKTLFGLAGELQETLMEMVDRCDSLDDQPAADFFVAIHDAVRAYSTTRAGFAMYVQGEESDPYDCQRIAGEGGHDG